MKSKTNSWFFFRFYLENDSDGDECPICYEPWEESGEHSLVSLKCGHLFGESCLKKWLNDQHAQQKQRLCPVCRTKVEVKHIRTLYARRVIQVKADPDVKRLKLELEQMKERARKYETLYKREREREKLFRTMQPIIPGQRGPSTSNANLPPLITTASLLRQQPPPNAQQSVPQQHPASIQLRTLSTATMPHLSVATTSRGLQGPPPYQVQPLYSEPRGIQQHIARFLFDDFSHDFSVVDQRQLNNM